MRNRYMRQSFLGPDAQPTFKRTCVGVIGQGGGGSHIVQQLVHVGFENYRLFDFDKVEKTNLNRMVGATEADYKNKTRKIDVAERVIRGVIPKAKIKSFNTKWQNVADELRNCDIVFGCVDGFSERNQLEAATRRYLTPYIDIGLDVHPSKNEPPRMTGQVILSMPGHLCMWCMGFLTDKKLGIEAKKYGVAGNNPQVVWGNGVLASSAIGIAVDLLTNWTKSLNRAVFISYDANTHSLTEDIRLTFLRNKTCPHYPLEDAGSPQFRAV
jgi:hypothetical protein